MKLLIVIVNYKTPALTVDCLASVAAELRDHLRGIATRVVVTDNKSPDDSVARITEAIRQHQWESWCSLLPMECNGGFAYGNNGAIRPALSSIDPPELVLLLNPDTVVIPGAIRSLVDAFDADPRTHLAGSRLEDPDATPQVSAFRFHRILNEFETQLRFGPISRLLGNRAVGMIPLDTPFDCQWVAGASLMIRKSVFDKIGLLDEGYFMYFEEVDFCLRAARAGFVCRYLPQSRVVHLVGQASGVTNNTKANKRRPAYWFEARRRYFIKNFGRPYAIGADLAFVAGFVPWRIRRAIQRKPDPDPSHMLGDIVRHSALFNGSPEPRRIQ